MDGHGVAEFLKRNPIFFEEYADLLAEIFVPHPHAGHAIPIAERQILTLREKNAELEAKLQELIRYGTDNDTISEKLHRSTLALFSATDLETTLGVLYHSLHEDFQVPQVAVRLWGKLPSQSPLPEFAAASPELRHYAAALGEPYCGTVPPHESRDWLQAQAPLTSFAFLPLRTEETFGSLALASAEPRRFYAGMGTMYLMRLAELASVATARFLPGS